MNAKLEARGPIHPLLPLVGDSFQDGRIAIEEIEAPSAAALETASWLKLYPAMVEGGAPIGVAEVEGGYLTAFGWRLSAATFRETPSGVDPVAKNLPIAVRVLQRTLASFRPGQQLTWRYGASAAANGSDQVEVKVIGSTSDGDADAAIASARELQHGALICLSALSENYGFAPMSLPEFPHPRGACRVTIKPARVVLSDGHGIGYSQGRDHRDYLYLQARPLKHAIVLEDVLHMVEHAGHRVVVDIQLSGVRLDSGQISRVERYADALRRGGAQVELENGDLRSGVSTSEDFEGTLSALDAWRVEPSGYVARCIVSSASSLPESVLGLIGAEVFHGRPVSFHQSVGPKATCISVPRGEPISGEDQCSAPIGLGFSDGVDLSQAMHLHELPPPLMPALNLLEPIGLPRLFVNPKVCLSSQGLHVGAVRQHARRVEMHLSEADRSRHCYMVGATGTGKSTLLRHLIVQDILRGAGVVLLDPVSDLYNQVVDCIPRSRENDLVLIDPTNFGRAVGINLLECEGPNASIQQNFIVNEFSSMFARMYDMRTVGGPGFDQYMRGALMLLMAAPPGQASLADITRVFNERTFREWLLSNCKDRFVHEFWEMAEKNTGDQALQNWGNYVTSKFAPFVQNSLIRPIISQTKSTIDFREVLDDQRILLVNLSKGILGERDSAFLGTLIITKLLAAALSRATMPKSHRKTSYIYVDEFQNVTSESLATILSEARKFGLSMTLAHQHVSQLPANVFHSIMGNTAVKLFFRVGAVDAPALEAYARPSFGANDLANLPDFHAICSIVSGEVPQPPFVCRTFSGVNEPTKEQLSSAAILAEHAMQKYTRGVEEIESALQGGDRVSADIGVDAVVSLLNGTVALSKVSRREEAAIGGLIQSTANALAFWREPWAGPLGAAAVKPELGKFFTTSSGALVLVIEIDSDGDGKTVVIRGGRGRDFPPGGVYLTSHSGRVGPRSPAGFLLGMDLVHEMPIVIDGYEWPSGELAHRFEWLTDGERRPKTWDRDGFTEGGFFRALNGSLVFIPPTDPNARALRATVCSGGHLVRGLEGSGPGARYELTRAGQILLETSKAKELSAESLAAAGGMSLAERLRVSTAVQEVARSADQPHSLEE